MTITVKDGNGNPQTVSTIDDLIAVLTAQAVAAGNAASPSPQILSVLDNTAMLRVAAVTVTGTGVLFTQDLSGNGRQYQTLVVDVTSIPSGATLVVEGSNDNTNWTTLAGVTLTNRGDGGQATLALNNGSGTGLFKFPCPVGFVRVRCSAYTSGNVTAGGFFTKGQSNLMVSVVEGPAASANAPIGNPLDNAARAATTSPTAVADNNIVRLMADKIGRTVTKPYAPADLDWQSGPITLTASSQALVAAGGAAIRNFMTWGHISCGSTWTANTLQILDGASVIYEIDLPAGAGVYPLPQLATPLKTTAATALNVKATGAVTGTCKINAGGYATA